MMDILSFDFMQNALWASLLVSIICGVIGTLIVINRMVFIAGGIAHGSYGGIGVGTLFWHRAHARCFAFLRSF